MWIFKFWNPWPSQIQGTFLLARGAFLIAGGGEHGPFLPPRPLRGRLRFFTQTHHKIITTTTTWDRKPCGNLTSISISFAQTECTDSQRNKSTLQFSFYLFSVHCGREIKISLSLQMGSFSCAMLQSREHFRLCGEQRPACLLTWLWRNVPL